MYKNKNILAIIPARGGSKGIPRKNIREIAGKPLIAWTISEAQKSNFIDRLILSSDDSEIIEVAKKWGCEVPFIRPAELAQDDTPRNPSVYHALSHLPGYDYVVLLQPTVPLRTVKDVDGCIDFCISNSAKACVSMVEQDPSPYWMFECGKDKRIKPLLGSWSFARRQDLLRIYALNGAVYIAEVEYFQKSGAPDAFITEETIAYIMPKERSLDIDTELDLKICEILLQNVR